MICKQSSLFVGQPLVATHLRDAKYLRIDFSYGSIMVIL